MAEVDPYAFSNAFNQQVQMGRQDRAYQNQLAQQGVDNERNKLRDMYMGKQEEREAARFGVEQQGMEQERQFQGLRLLNAASAEIAQNPSSASRWYPQLKQFGLPVDDPTTANPAELQAQAKQMFESTSAALQAYSSGQQGVEGFGQPQSVVGADGRTQLVQFGNRGSSRPVNDYRPNPLEQYGRVNPGDYTPESLARYAQTGNFSDLVRIWAPVVQSVGNVPTAIGRTMDAGGMQATQTPLSTIQQEASGAATVASAEAGARSGAQIRAETQANAQAGLADLEAETANMTENIRGLINSPGFSTIYGLSAALDPRSYTPGTQAANSAARLEQLSAQAFQAAIQKMRGLGALSEAEGKKVSAAYTRATNTKQSEEAAREAWIEVITRLESAQDRARRRASNVAQAPGAPQVGEIRKGYRYKGGDPSQQSSWELVR